jgi:hypothetical protein
VVSSLQEFPTKAVYASFEVFTTVKTIRGCMGFALCSAMVGYQRFGGSCCLHLQGWSQPITLHSTTTQKTTNYSKPLWISQFSHACYMPANLIPLDLIALVVFDVLTTTAWTLRSQVRILLGAWMCVRVFLCCFLLSCVGRGLESGWSPGQGVLPNVTICRSRSPLG